MGGAPEDGWLVLRVAGTALSQDRTTENCRMTSEEGVVLRSPRADELEALSALCLRSKAVWGYDAAFLEACREELTLTTDDLQATQTAVVEEDGYPVGVVQIGVEGDVADLLLLFIEPTRMRAGHGKRLFAWAVQQARDAGAVRMTIEADPGAVPFYRACGATDAGTAASASIAGRTLPLLVYDLAGSPDRR